MTKFEHKVLKLVAQIPKGKVTTYQIIAEKLGSKKLTRAVGNALPKNPSLIEIPCHRVVKSNGELGFYVLGLAKKKSLLQDEGIKIKGKQILDFPDYLYYFN
jgi:methylated-DNA-[protein]-cysteine S-methyltransferase